MSAPFGIEFYTPISALADSQEVGQGHYMVTPPKPHPMFEGYIVRATPSLGIVWIKAMTPTIANDKFGAATRGQVDRLAEQLTQKYGQGAKTDLLLAGSIWTDPQDWTSGLCERERFYNVVWEAPAVRLPDNLEHIFVGATPVDGYDVMVVVEYSSRRLGEADAEMERVMADLL